MNEQRWMMFCYKLAWLLMLLFFFLSDKAVLPHQWLSSKFNYLVWAALIAALTCLGFMYFAAKKAKAKKYARSNLLLGICLNLFVGLGFILWPILINSEINKMKNHNKSWDDNSE